jgi:pimeloyl-ACP methyl ester carboxylesterase
LRCTQTKNLENLFDEDCYAAQILLCILGSEVTPKPYNTVMIDSLYARHSLKIEQPLDPGYKPSDVIISKKLVNKNSPKLSVVLPGWHNHAQEFPINRLTKRLAKKGWAVLVYDFHDQLLEPDEDMVVESFEYIRSQISRDIERLVAEHHYQQVHLIGISLGTVAWALVADKYKEFTSATIVLGGDDLAIDMWHGIRTQHYRQAFEKLHIGIRKLDKEWQTIAPVNHLKHFRGKKVRVVMSLSDEFILTKYQKRLIERLVQNGASVSVKRSRLGHALTIVRFCLFGSPL